MKNLKLAAMIAAVIMLGSLALAAENEKDKPQGNNGNANGKVEQNQNTETKTQTENGMRQGQNGERGPAWQRDGMPGMRRGQMEMRDGKMVCPMCHGSGTMEPGMMRRGGPGMGDEQNGEGGRMRMRGRGGRGMMGPGMMMRRGGPGMGDEQNGEDGRMMMRGRGMMGPGMRRMQEMEKSPWLMRPFEPDAEQMEGDKDMPRRPMHRGPGMNNGRRAWQEHEDGRDDRGNHFGQQDNEEEKD